MDWPAANAPAVLDPRVIFRARDVRAVIAVDRALRGLGLSAPEIHAADIDAGLLLLEDIGAEPIHHDGVPDRERYETAVDVLALLHAAPRPAALPLPDGTLHRLPAFTAEAFAVEVSMFLDWYVPHATGRPVANAARATFTALWAEIIARLAGKEPGWVLLDYHSPNLYWLAGREGVARLAIIDFQDLMVGPSAYDVASLCQDARVTIPAGLEAALRQRYVAARRAADPGFDSEAFAEAYAILAAQRATKILGVFARLADHAGKPGYLRHMPRLREYLERSLAHPAMSRYANWLRRKPAAVTRPIARRERPCRKPRARNAPWCLPLASASACARSPSPFRSRSSRSPAARSSTTPSIASRAPASRKRWSTSTTCRS